MDRKLNNRICFSRKSCRLTQKSLARLLEISEPTMNHYETGKRVPTAALLQKMVSLFKCDPAWLLTGETAGRSRAVATASAGGTLPPRPQTQVEGFYEDFVYVPRFHIDSITGDGEIQSLQVVDHLAFKAEWVKYELKTEPDQLLLMDYRGDAMDPTLRSGDLVLVDQAQSRFVEDGIYLLQIDRGLTIKRIEQRVDGNIAIRGDNPSASREEILSVRELSKVKLVGRLVWVGKKI